MKRWGWAMALAAGLALGLGAAAQEHPTQAEHPAGHPAAKAVSKSTLEKAIRERIADKTKEDGGKFRIHDDVLSKDWALELVRVHTDKLTQIDAITYFACTDFRADDGTMVDVDFYMKNDSGKLALADTTIHKINGKPRFNYEKKGEFWERVKAGG
jgi:hypothetical protein